MNWFPLPLFPEGSLASSIVTTVWVGVLVFSFMNLRFGWVYSGLVVPGYIVPLLIVKPWAAGIIVIEAVVTLWTVQGLSRLLAKSGIACEFFGRDRFLALLMVSSFYRIVGDIWWLPAIGEFVTTQFGISFDYQNNLQSFGLIVICLAANQLWKTGVIRGALPFVFNVAVTFILIRYVLMEFTNFSITNLSYLYEDIATSVYAAPKAYIILITTAILASRMNLIYGWDFNGILIPALIALQWYDPVKVLTSFVEAILVLFIAVQVLKLPFFRSLTVEGSRKFLLFFTISFIYKMTVGWAMFFLEPSAKVSDFYGFGYLLPTLMAMKMHQHERVWHQIRITTQLSLASVIVANIIGFSLTFVPSRSSAFAGENLGSSLSETQRYQVSELRNEAYRSFIELHQSILDFENKVKASPETLRLFESGLKELTNPDGLSSAALGRLEGSGFRVDQFGEHYYRIYPRNPGAGLPLILINRKTESDLVVHCPDAFDNRHLFDASFNIFTDQKAKLLCVSGSGDETGADWEVAIQRAKPEQWGLIEVSLSDSSRKNKLFIKKSLPKSLELGRIEEQFGELNANWTDSNRRSVVRELADRNYCEFQLGSQAKQTIVKIKESAEPIDAVCRRVCHEFSPRASGLYEPPSEAELLHIDRNILAPLFGLTIDNLNSEVEAIRKAASYYGFRVTRLKRDGEIFVILWKPDHKKKLG